MRSAARAPSVAKTLLTLRDIVVRYDERVALRVPSLDIEAGDVEAFIAATAAFLLRDGVSSSAAA